MNKIFIHFKNPCRATSRCLKKNTGSDEKGAVLLHKTTSESRPKGTETPSCAKIQRSVCRTIGPECVIQITVKRVKMILQDKTEVVSSNDLRIKV